MTIGVETLQRINAAKINSWDEFVVEPAERGYKVVMKRSQGDITWSFHNTKDEANELLEMILQRIRAVGGFGVP